jgi:hypothetical protein
LLVLEFCFIVTVFFALPWPSVIKVKLSLRLTKHYAMKTYGGVDV